MNSEDAVRALKSNTYIFGEFQLEAENLLLLRNSEVVPLAPKACEVLLSLIESNGKLITKQEILDKVWKDTFVEEANLTHHISALRKALGEDKNGRKFIETIPRRGYRFVAPIVEANNGAMEILISERVTARTIEEVEFETSAIEKVEADENKSALDNSPNVLASSENTFGKRRNRKGVYVFAVSSLVALIVLAGIFGNRLFSRKSDKLEISPQTLVSKRLMPDKDTISPAISPDGKFAVFTLLENGQSSVWQKNLATGEMSQFTPAAPLSEIFDGAFRYSPDGQWVYFAHQNFKTKKASINRIAATGGAPQIMLENLEAVRSDFSISPDNRQVAFVRDFNKLIVADLETKIERVVSERSSNQKAFGNPGSSSPTWSPDGQRIIIGGTNAETMPRKNELIEVDLATGSEKIIALSEDLRVYQTAWLADGSGLMVTASEATGVPHQIRHISLPDGKVTTLTNEDFGFCCFKLSKDSRTMIAEKETGARNIWIADAKNLAERKQITIGGSADQGSQSLAISNLGKIIYTSPNNGYLDLWSVGSDGSSQQQLTKNTGRYNQAEKVTPDEKYIVFNSIRSGDNQVWRINIDGSNPVQLSNNGFPASSQKLSPDGKTVYFSSFVPDQIFPRVYQVSIEGGEPTELTNRKYVFAPNYSPDGKLMIFYEQIEGQRQPKVSIIETATEKVICPPEKMSVVQSEKWSGDSKHLLYSKNLGQELWQYDVYDDKHEKIADFRPNTMYNFAVSPDGKKFVFSLGNISDETILFTNYLSETK